MFGRFCAVMLLMLAVTVDTPAAQAAPMLAPTTKIEVGTLPPIEVAKPVPPFNAEKAIAAYLGTVKGEAKAKSDAYFEGGYTLLFVDAIYALAICVLLLWGRVSSWMRNRAMKTMFMVAGAFAMLLKSAPEGLRNRVVRFFMAPGWQVAVYGIQYLVLTAVLTFPLTVYEGFFREHAYGLSNQTFGQWFGDFGTGFIVTLIFATLGLVALYALIRRAGRAWWAWATGLFMVFSVVGMMLGPVYIAPLFNTYTPLPDSVLKSEILAQAKANGIPVDNVYVVDASKQSKRISANVSGLFGTTRISLNDNLLDQTTPQETLAVLGHEMGH
ncbi:MAG TPA: M48 family metalloprotease, partial [Rhizomicrobium sp.]|nr:M48 family metalloprotease [Rhizomicrobium sp.]